MVGGCQLFLGTRAVRVKEERPGQLREELRRADAVVDGHAAVIGIHHVHGDPPAPRGDLIPRKAHALCQGRGLLHGPVRAGGARLLRWQDAAPSERTNLIPMDYEQYEQWSENARLTREEYVQGNLTAEEFLRKIDTTHELASYEAGKAKLSDGPSIWQQLVARDFRFDPERYFPKEMVRLDMGVPDPQWQVLTADDLRREAQKGYQSLKDKYGK